LFFELLNSDRSAHNDLCARTGTKVPYLNSGLFEAERLTKYKRSQAIEQHRRVFIPSGDVESMLDFLDQFNFTVDENSPTESDIGIDPEMLGHIFENLLEDNRNKGAFYTPPMATSNSPTYGQSNSPMAGQLDYAESEAIAIREAASFIR
jgi:hypothetical protein